MIVFLAQMTDWANANRTWLFSLAAAAAINMTFIWLASIAPIANVSRTEPAAQTMPVEIIFRRPTPPPPDLDFVAASELPPSALPPRFRPRMSILQTQQNQNPVGVMPVPRLRLNLTPCDPADDERMRMPDCALPQEWLRADRDASGLLGASAQGYTLDEVAVARGWIRPKPRTGQDAMATTTDATLPDSIFKDPPFAPHAIERTAGDQ